jgi:hypothetical protein
LWLRLIPDSFADLQAENFPIPHPPNATIVPLCISMVLAINETLVADVRNFLVAISHAALKSHCVFLRKETLPKNLLLCQALF